MLRYLIFWTAAVCQTAYGLKLIGPTPTLSVLPMEPVGSGVAGASGRQQFLQSLESCSSSLQIHIDCLKTLKERAGDAHDALNKIKEVKDTMKKIDAGFDTIDTLASIGRLIPGVGTFLGTLNKGIDRVTAPFDSGYNKIKSLESSTSSARSAAAATEKNLAKVISVLEKAQTVCEKGQTSFQAAVNCLEDYESDKSSQLGANLDSMVNALNPGLSRMTSVVEDVGDICSATNMVQLPNINTIESGINSFYNVLDDALDFFDDIQDVLDEEACFIVCFSVQDLLDGISGALDWMLGWAFDLVDEALKGIPTPDLPNMPDFDILDRFDADISMPDLDFDIAVDFFETEFNKLTWDCSIGVQFECIHGISLSGISCSTSLGSFTGREVSPSVHHGCWASGTIPALSGSSYSFDFNSIEKCKEACRNDGHRYAGLSNGNICLCGDDYDKYGRSSLCNKDCPGNSDERCGGLGAVDVYSSGYLGCWKDSRPRAVAQKFIMEDANVGNCIQMCKEKGYIYAGAQFSHQCFCGNSYDAYGEAPESECNRPCRDNSNQICGGTWRNSVYDVSQVGTVPVTRKCDNAGSLFAIISCNVQLVAEGLAFAG